MVSTVARHPRSRLVTLTSDHYKFPAVRMPSRTTCKQLESRALPSNSVVRGRNATLEKGPLTTARFRAGSTAERSALRLQRHIKHAVGACLSSAIRSTSKARAEQGMAPAA